MEQTSTRKKQRSSTAHRVAEKTLDVAVGGTALAADKVAETVDRVLEKAENAVREGRRDTQDKAEAASRAIRRTIKESDGRRYEDRTRDDLYELAVQRNIEGRSAMRKSELIAALRAEQ